MEFLAAHSAEKDDAAFVDDASQIAFAHVDVYTPTGVLLVKDLNFTLRAGTNLLLTGCNGSGKSSIFRCLGGLWKVPKGGVITKPGGGASDGLHAAVFYLPQRPYNPTGTLREQLCYPHRVDSEGQRELTQARMRAMLDAVDLGYLIERFPRALGFEAGDDDDVDWSGVLSMGEKQRLAMARLFWHQPRFAVLDECTSGVSAAMERKLYDTCTERGISCVTISHRPVLRRYHDLILNVLADGEGGYTHTMTYSNKLRLGIKLAAEESAALRAAGGDAASDRGASSASAASTAAASSDVADARASSGTGEEEIGGYSAAYYGSESDATVERARMETRSAAYTAAAAAQRGGSGRSHIAAAGSGSRAARDAAKWSADIGFIARLRIMWRALMPNGMSLHDPETRRILLLFGIVVGKTVVENAASAVDGYAVSTVLQSDYYVFLRAAVLGAAVRSSLTWFDIALIRGKWDRTLFSCLCGAEAPARPLSCQLAAVLSFSPCPPVLSFSRALTPPPLALWCPLSPCAPQHNAQ